MYKLLITLFLFIFVSCDPFPVTIKQNVGACNNGFKITTTVVYKMKIVYLSDTYRYTDNSCLSAEKVDSAKKAERSKAEVWVFTFNKIKD